jgi:hypothetical protein
LGISPTNRPCEQSVHAKKKRSCFIYVQGKKTIDAENLFMLFYSSHETVQGKNPFMLF